MKRDLLVTATLLAAGMLTVMSGAIIAPSLNGLADHFTNSGQSNLLASLILVMPSLGIVLFAPLIGWIADRYGYWRTLAVSVLVLMVSGTSGYWTDSYGPLLMQRFILGCGIAGISISATSVLGSLPAEAKRQELLGKQSAFTNLAGMTYLLLGGMLAALHWRLPFLLYLWPVILMPFIILSMRVQPLIQTGGTVSQPGDFIAFLRSASLPAAVLVWLLGGLSMAVIYTLFTVHPFRMEELGFEDPRLVSFTIMAATATSAATGWNLKRISLYLSAYNIFAFSFLMFGIGLLVMSVAREVWHVVGGNLLMGVGMGLPVPNGAVWLSAIAPASVRGRILGIFNACVFLGQFLSPLLLRAIEYFSSHIFLANAAIGTSCLAISFLMAAAAVFRKVAWDSTGDRYAD